ncbi:NUDIX hydrolase [Rhizobium binae]|uniref:NUDIX hydrolase n=1 Tax=Rhizobium binae TaxID=1138190 RepID=UPI001C835815|nr:NUDIX hydrolase [Rhizobium binae]MBX4927427.1 NUDIX hydrolase [Rhizobium binae]MBX4938688.1 NUDIX hydrolase [Rhizobium binae]MBX4945311.1 NUDIX hydrolase [Rhizobium binae]MBX4948560.1 NUDIX hydrolase [Rhizobium binae]MBX4962379.1 NUDIX hydrolase [Rhizobium binae]
MNKAPTLLSELAGHAETILLGKALEQFGALCLRQGAGGLEVLLITTRETGRWTIPKGWPIKGLAPHEVVEREAWEEAGVKGRAKKRAFGCFSYLKTFQDGTQVPSFVTVHIMTVRRTKANFPERRERKLAWMPPLEAASLVNEPELKSLFRRVRRRALS